ncbi:aldo/keto reductase [Paenibacillus sp. 79R4]|uniref:aldo/keto reductase n=1 Tax=Paenibacillus sp. 79R4 TaxID=2212847 RepID=UPI0015B7EBF1|nr:aldo/keto reductase [Paenibacillus sp. 79R4]
MRCGHIPNTELEAARICFGTAGVGASISEADAFTLLDAYCERGGNFIDTASVYSDWESDVKSVTEKTLGKWLKSRGQRSSIILATKGGHPARDKMSMGRLTREDIAFDLDHSLLNLGTDVIDLYWLHRDDISRPVEDIIDMLEEHVRAGCIRYYACSNWTVERIEAARQYAASIGKSGFVANQMQWSLAVVNPEGIADPTTVQMDGRMLDYHISTGLAAIPYTSQAQGFFSGKYRPEERTKVSVVNMFYNEVNFGRLARVQETAKQLGCSGTEVALAYLTSQSFPAFPIIGCRTRQQLEESLKAGDLQLDSAAVRYLREG